MARRTTRRAVALAVLALLAGCTGGSDPEPGSRADSTTASPPHEPRERITAMSRWSDADGWEPLPTAPLRPPVEQWSTPAQRTADGDFQVAGDVIALVDRSGEQVTARRVSPVTGEDLWRTPLVLPGELHVEVDPSGTLLLATGRAPCEDCYQLALRVLDVRTGTVLWSADAIPYGVTVDPVGDLLVVHRPADYGGADPGRDRPASTIAVDRTTGATRWTLDRETTVDEGRLVIDEYDRFGVVDVATGAVGWERLRSSLVEWVPAKEALPDGASGDVAVAQDLVVVTVASLYLDTRAFAFDPGDGTFRWQRDLDVQGSVDVSPVAPDGLLVTGVERWRASGTEGLDASTGRSRWRRPDDGDGDVVGLDGFPSYGQATQGRLLRLGDRPVVAILEGGRDVLVDARDGTVVASGDRTGLEASFGLPVAAGAVYASRYDRGGPVVVARDLPGWGPRWEVGLGPDEELVAAIDDGFVTEEMPEAVGVLRGYRADTGR